MCKSIRTLVVSLAAACFTTVLADAIKAPACLAVADSQGKVVGTFVQALVPFQNGNALVALDIQGRVLTVQADTTGVLGGDEGFNFVYFLSSDCSGAPYIPFTYTLPTSLLPRTSVASPNQTLYAQVPGAPAVEITALSYLQAGDPTCEAIPAFSAVVVQASAVMDLSTLIHPPLTMIDHGCQ